MISSPYHAMRWKFVADRSLIGFGRAKANSEGVNMALLALDDFDLVNIES